MLFMMLDNSEAATEGEAWMPSPEAVAAMMEYNKSLNEAGVLLSLDGLHPPTEGARVSFTDGKASVTDGPFSEAKEVVGGYWLIQVNSKEEAIAWARRCPAAMSNVIEVRQVFDMSEFPPELQEVAADFNLRQP
jgi:hypothetical protein